MDHDVNSSIWQFKTSDLICDPCAFYGTAFPIQNLRFSYVCILISLMPATFPVNGIILDLSFQQFLLKITFYYASKLYILHSVQYRKKFTTPKPTKYTMQLRILLVWCRVLHGSFWKYVTSLLVENTLPSVLLSKKMNCNFFLNTRQKSAFLEKNVKCNMTPFTQCFEGKKCLHLRGVKVRDEHKNEDSTFFETS
jgi:hypothetical protein